MREESKKLISLAEWREAVYKEIREKANRTADRAPLRAHAPSATYLKVPYAEKDEAKAMGAWWDPQKKAWYVPGSRDPAPFLKKWA